MGGWGCGLQKTKQVKNHRGHKVMSRGSNSIVCRTGTTGDLTCLRAALGLCERRQTGGAADDTAAHRVLAGDGAGRGEGCQPHAVTPASKAPTAAPLDYRAPSFLRLHHSTTLFPQHQMFFFPPCVCVCAYVRVAATQRLQLAFKCAI